MLNTGFPSDANESTLSQIFEVSHAAPKILFEQDSLFGNTAESGSTGEGFTAKTQGSTNVTSRDKTIDNGQLRIDNANEINSTNLLSHQQIVNCLNPWDTQNNRVFAENGVSPTLSGANDGKSPAGLLLASCDINTICVNDQGGERIDISQEEVGTLRAQSNHPPIVLANEQNSTSVLFDNNATDGRFNGPLEIAPTVTARYGTGGNNTPLVSEEPDSYCIAGNIIGRDEENGGNGFGYQADISYTLTGADRHAVYNRRGYSGFSEDSSVAATESAHQAKDATDLVCENTMFGQSQYSSYAEGCATLRASGGSNGGGSENLVCETPDVSEASDNAAKYRLIRRLTPLECERLQGFPDFWTDIPGASDSARYKALGNSVAIPCVELVMRGIAYFLRKIYDGTENVQYD
jgi:hypothetical protein